MDEGVDEGVRVEATTALLSAPALSDIPGMYGMCPSTFESRWSAGPA